MVTDKRRQALATAVVTAIFLASLAWVTVSADQFYSVRKGDTLTGLARRFHTTVAELARRNNLKDKDKLYIGQGLIIPGRSSGVQFPALPAGVRRRLAGVRVTPGKWKHIVIHHSGTYMGTVKGMDRFHREERHMENGLAYHFVIGNGKGMGDGEIAVGNRWIRQLDGGHLRTEKLNSKSIGICLVGDFEHNRPTAKQMDSLRALTHDLLTRCKLGADSICTHQQINTVYTRCPGRRFPTKAFLAEFKDRP